MKKIFITESEEETLVLAESLGKNIAHSFVITLEGDLGAGKTTFTKGLGKGLGVKRVITSPTFTIIKEYLGRLPLYHIDAYRLEFSEEDLGIDEYLMSDGITVIEWAQFIEDLLPDNKLAITINYISEAKRELIFETEDTQIEKIIIALFEDFKGEKK